MKKSNILATREAAAKLSALGERFIVVRNPEFIFPEYELYPLPLPAKIPLTEIRGIVMDMDGTTTTTEVLCIHSLEYMVRHVTGRTDHASWKGLDPKQDYPNIIGNSTTRHIEYLLTTYGQAIVPGNLLRAFVYAAFWTFVYGKDANRKAEVTANIRLGGLESVFAPYLQESSLRTAAKKHASFENSSMKLIDAAIAAGVSLPELLYVRVCTDIYYQRYHFILQHIREGTTSRLLRELPPDLHRSFIEPMEGIGEFLALAKGLLGDEAGKLRKQLLEKWAKKDDDFNGKGAGLISSKDLSGIGKNLRRRPAKIAVVTSSIFFEADIVLDEVFRQIVKEIPYWNVSTELKNTLRAAFSNYRTFYDGVVTASDSHEIRLKPHRDLYSIALYKLGLSRADLPYVIGFEDSESGNIAIKAAGIGLAVAVPFAQTANHNLESADFILKGGIPETILKHNIFL